MGGRGVTEWEGRPITSCKVWYRTFMCISYLHKREESPQNLWSIHQQHKDQKLYNRQFTSSEEAGPTPRMLSPWEWPGAGPIILWVSISSCRTSTLPHQRRWGMWSQQKQKPGATNETCVHMAAAPQVNSACPEVPGHGRGSYPPSCFVSFCHLLGYIFRPLVLTLFPK